ncbi:hypothetical protein TPA0907_02940 [Micromonospora humidisoli]|nr:hypothetical protein TPA0907_02940 [Micromonospora sp. AKA109]
MRGLTIAAEDRHGALHGVAGIVDKPLEQRRDPLWLDLAGAAGNVMVVGAPQTGKSNLLRTLVTSLALGNTPREAQFYCLDFGGGTLAALAGLPHVGGVASRREVDKVRRTIAELHGLMQARDALFTAHAVEGAAAYRRARREGRFPEDPFGDVFLVVDGWAALRAEFEDWSPWSPSWRTGVSATASTSWPPPTGGWTSGPRCGTCSVRRWSCASASRPTR